MRVLVTGGSGFLGRAIVSAANDSGYETFAPQSKEFDLYTMKGVDRYLSNTGPVDVIIHSAAHYGGLGINQAEPARIFNINMQMTVNVFEIARAHKVKKVLPIGSACAYPGFCSDDLLESEFWSGPLHESVEAYGMSKKIQLVAQRAYYQQYGILANHLILTNLYGLYDVFTEYRAHVLSALIKKFTDASERVTLWGDGSPIREFLYVEDAADAIVRAIALDHDLDPINIGTGEGISIKDLANLIATFTGFDGVIEWDTSKPNGTARKVLDITRMQEKLDWSPRWSLRDGLKKTITWYLDNKNEADARQ